MKRYILVGFALCAGYIYAADRDEKISLPSDIRHIIAVQFAQAGSTFDELIERIKNFMKADKNFYTLLSDSKKIEPVLEALSRQWNIPPSAIAFAINTPGAQQWLKNKYPTKILFNIAQEVLKDRYLDSDFFNSIFFLKLIDRLSPEEYNALWREISDAFNTFFINNQDATSKTLTERKGYSALKKSSLLAIAWFTTREISNTDKFALFYIARYLDTHILPTLPEGLLKQYIQVFIKRVEDKCNSPKSITRAQTRYRHEGDTESGTDYEEDSGSYSTEDDVLTPRNGNGNGTPYGTPPTPRSGCIVS